MPRQKNSGGVVPGSNISDVTGLWANVQRARANGHDVVNLAGVYDADKFVAHDNHV